MDSPPSSGILPCSVSARSVSLRFAVFLFSCPCNSVSYVSSVLRSDLLCSQAECAKMS